MQTDPVADFLTSIRNGAHARKSVVDVPWSDLKERLARVLAREGFLEDVAVVEGTPRNVLRVTLRYDDRRVSVINGIKRISRPSLRRYAGCDEIGQIRRGLGVSILSTPKGLLVDREARKQKVGGEILCKVW